VTPEHLTLTSYFGERQRAGGAFFADTQLELFGRHRIAASILLRGVSGFGFRHHFRTSGTLTLSEDLPLVSVAVDTRSKIEHLVSELTAPGHRGLVTVEPTLLLSPERPGEPPRANTPDAKLTLYLGRHQRVYKIPAFAAVCDLLHRRGLDAAIVLPGVDGTRHGERTRARLVGRNGGVPTMIVAVGPTDRAARVIPELGGLLDEPLISLEHLQLCKTGGQLVAHPRILGGLASNGVARWQKLTVYSSAASHYQGEPVHRALVRHLRTSQARGATVLSGMWGFEDGRKPYGHRLWNVGRSAPMCTILVDTAARIARSFKVVDEITRDDGVVTIEEVPALVASTGGPSRPPALGGSTRHVVEGPPRSSPKSIGRWPNTRSVG
jgi:PII-like signaling protein